MSFIIKIQLLGLALSLSALAADKIQYFPPSSFNSTLLLINGISCDLQKLLKYFNDTAVAAFFKIHFALFATALYLKDVKLLSLEISALKLLASSFE